MYAILGISLPPPVPSNHCTLVYIVLHVQCLLMLISPVWTLWEYFLLLLPTHPFSFLNSPYKCGSPTLEAHKFYLRIFVRVYECWLFQSIILNVVEPAKTNGTMSSTFLEYVSGWLIFLLYKMDVIHGQKENKAAESILTKTTAPIVYLNEIFFINLHIIMLNQYCGNQHKSSPRQPP